MGIKELLLNKGWAGRTIDRAETADRLNPVIRTLTELMHYYEDLAASGHASGHEEAFADHSRTLRMDVGKMCEAVFSCAGVAYSGTDIEPESLKLGDDPFVELADLEAAFRAQVDAETEVEHQMRTRAILMNVKANSEARSKALRSVGGR